VRGHGGRTKQQASLNLGGRAKALCQLRRLPPWSSKDLTLHTD